MNIVEFIERLIAINGNVDLLIRADSLEIVEIVLNEKHFDIKIYNIPIFFHLVKYFAHSSGISSVINIKEDFSISQLKSIKNAVNNIAKFFVDRGLSLTAIITKEHKEIIEIGKDVENPYLSLIGFKHISLNLKEIFLLYHAYQIQNRELAKIEKFKIEIKNGKLSMEYKL